MTFLAQVELDPSQSAALSAALFYLFALMSAGSAVAVAASRNVVRMAVALLFTLAGVAGLYFLLNAEFLAAVQLVVYAGGTLILIVFGVMLTAKSPFSRFEPKMGEIAVAMTVAVVLLAALVLAVPVGRTSEPMAAGRLAGAFVSLPPALRAKVQYDGSRLWFRGAMSPADRQVLLDAIDAENRDRVSAADDEVAKAEMPDEKTRAQGRADQEKAALAQEYPAARASVEALAGRTQRFFLADDPLPSGGGYPVSFLGEQLLGDYLLPFELSSVLLLVVMIGAAYLAKGRRREEAPAGRRAVEAATSREARQWT